MPILPENILRLLSPEERAKLGAGNQTASEAQERWQKGEERKMHEQFTQWLRLNSTPFLTSRFGVKATIRAGWPDFSVIRKGRVALVEFKAPGGKLKEAQRECIAELQATGTPVAVCETVEAAIVFVRRELFADAGHAFTAAEAAGDTAQTPAPPMLPEVRA